MRRQLGRRVVQFENVNAVQSEVVYKNEAISGCGQRGVDVALLLPLRVWAMRVRREVDVRGQAERAARVCQE